VISLFTTSIDPVVWDVVIGGLRSSQQLEIKYTTPGKLASKRKIDPYHEVRFKRDWYIVGYYHLRGEIRSEDQI
jgi:predicted DNA-binding transcriptional regulator YafY